MFSSLKGLNALTYLDFALLTISQPIKTKSGFISLIRFTIDLIYQILCISFTCKSLMNTILLSSVMRVFEIFSVVILVCVHQYIHIQIQIINAMLIHITGILYQIQIISIIIKMGDMARIT
jgi:hypothetical protein